MIGFWQQTPGQAQTGVVNEQALKLGLARTAPMAHTALASSNDAGTFGKAAAGVQAWNPETVSAHFNTPAPTRSLSM